MRDAEEAWKGGTAVRHWPCWKQIGITQERYWQLLYFCRQYPDWKAEADSLLGIRAVKMDGMPHGSGKSDPVAMAAEKRDKLLEKIKIVDDCAKDIEDGKWYAVLIQHVCNGKSYEQLDKALMPTSFRNAFFTKRKLFFELLDKRVE